MEKNKIYDVVYSVMIHQSIDYVNDFISNIEKYDKINNYLIIIHLNNELYKQKDKIIKNKVIINPNHYDKKRFSVNILNAYLDNFNYLNYQNIKFNNYMTLVSSCRFVRDCIKFNKQNINVNITTKDYDPNSLKKDWFWPQFYKNTEIIDILIKYKIDIHNSGHQEGYLFDKNIFDSINKFIINNKLLEIIRCETVFEEILLNVLHFYFTGKSPIKYTKKFVGIKHNPNYCGEIDNNQIPTKSHIIACLKNNKNILNIKRFPNDLNHILFQQLKNNEFDL